MSALVIVVSRSIHDSALLLSSTVELVSGDLIESDVDRLASNPPSSIIARPGCWNPGI